MNYFVVIACISLSVPLLLASESFDKSNIGRTVEHVELVLVIEIACKTKTTLMRAQWDKIKMENEESAERVKIMKERGKGKDKETSAKGKEKVKLDKDEGKGMKGVKRGMRALKEIK